MNPEIKMRTSRVLRQLRAGKVAFCTKMNLSDSRAFEIAASGGFDCLWTCQEHVGTDYRTLETQVLAAKAHDCDLLCRVPKGSYSDYIRPMELDTTGIMIPHVMSLEEAKALVRVTRFHPLGRRPLDGGNADGGYCRVPLADYLEQSNRERFVVLQIEDPEPLAELEEIAALPGYDILFFGPGDFSHSIGAPGDFSHPRLLEARKEVARLARKYGKAAGIPGSLGNYRELIDLGYNFISIGADVCALGDYYKNIMGTVTRETDMPQTSNSLYKA